MSVITSLKKSVFRFPLQWIGFFLLTGFIAFSTEISPQLTLASPAVRTTRDLESEVGKLTNPQISPLKKSITCRSDYNQDMVLCLRRAEALGAQTVVLTVSIFQERKDSSSVYLDKAKTLDKRHVQEFVDAAHHDGVLVILKPILLVANNTIQRDTIIPKDRKTWFVSYKAMLGTFLIWSKDIDGLVLGTELTSMQRDEAAWEDIVSYVRSLRGKLFLAYDINWDALQPLRWLERLDAIGISAYFPLCTSATKPGVKDLVSCWNSGTKQRLLAYVHHYALPFWFTEIGLTAREGSNRTPWTTPATSWCPQCQANWFIAAITVWDKTSGFLGFTWWSLTADACIAKVKNNGFNYFDDPAYEVLLKYFGRKPISQQPKKAC